MFRSNIAIVLAICLCASSHAAPPAAPPAPGYKAGYAWRDITPDIGMEQPGGYGKSFHKIRHDTCKARASVFDDGKDRVAIVGLDALIIRRPQVEAARKAIAQKTGIAPQNILISASHSHSAGPVGMILPGEYDQGTELIKDLAYNKSSNADAKYLQKLEQAIIDAVVEANDKRVAAKCAVGVGIEDKVSFNRRFRMKNGLSYTHPGQNNPDIVEPAGPIDPQVGVIGSWDDKGNLLGCVVNFACHATTGPGGTSADYIYYIEKTICGLLGEQAVVVFVNGCCGDVTQVDNRLPYNIKQHGELSSRLVGGRVGAEALKILLSTQASGGSLSPVAAKTQILQINHRPPSPEKVSRAMETIKKQPGKEVDASEWIFAKETVLLDARLKKGTVASVEVQAIQVGPAVFLACPAEYFVEFGLDMKARSKFPFTFPVSLANDCVGYVPTEDALSPRGGGYETRLTSYSNLEPKAGKKMADALVELSGKMTPGPVPTPPTALPFTGKPWAYGNVPPELQ